MQPDIQAIAQQYTEYLGQQSEPSSLPERLQFSAWLYEHHAKHVGYAGEIWKALKQK